MSSKGLDRLLSDRYLHVSHIYKRSHLVIVEDLSNTGDICVTSTEKITIWAALEHRSTAMAEATHTRSQDTKLSPLLGYLAKVTAIWFQCFMG